MKPTCLFATFIILFLFSCNNTADHAVENKKVEHSSKSKGVEPSSLPPPNNQSCIWQVYEILESSDKFKEITKGLEERIKKNGGTTYGLLLEGSPEPEKDTALAYSETYDISLHESYPDRMVNVERFTFDKRTMQLYQYDPVDDTLRAISFEKKLLLNLCK